MNTAVTASWGRAVEQVVPCQGPRGGDGGADAGQGEGAADEGDPSR